MNVNDGTVPCPTCGDAVQTSTLRAIARAREAEAAEARAHAAITRNDERHASELAAVRKRAERAEAEVDAISTVIRDVADDCLAVQPADAPLSDLVHGLGDMLHQYRTQASELPGLRMTLDERAYMVARLRAALEHIAKASPVRAASLAIDALSGDAS